MFFPATVEYALRAMALLVRQEPDERMRADEIARATNVPKPYLSKILRKLVLAGLLDATKGHGGGFRLARSPDTLVLADVFEAVGYDMHAERCVFGWARCSDDHPCPLHHAWFDLKNRLRDWSETTPLRPILDEVHLSKGSASTTARVKHGRLTQ